MFAELDQELGDDIHANKTKQSIKFKDFADAKDLENSHLSNEIDTSDERDIRDRQERPVNGARLHEIRRNVLSEEPRQIEYTSQEMRVLNLPDPNFAKISRPKTPY